MKKKKKNQKIKRKYRYFPYYKKIKFEFRKWNLFFFINFKNNEK